LKLVDIAKQLNIEYLGDPHQEISGVSSPQNPIKNTLCYVSDKKYINQGLSKVGAILSSKEISKNLPVKNFLLSDNHKIIFAQLTYIFATESSVPKLDPKTNLFKGNNFSFGSNFSHGVGVIIEDDVKLGKNVSIGHNVVIHRSTVIGNNVSIGPGTVVGSEGFGNVIDDNQKWKHIAHLGKVIIGDNVSIGSNCSIDRGTLDNTIIFSGVIIDNQVHIAHNVQIGEDTAIAANVGIAGSCKIGKRNMIGGMVGIIDHITTTDDVIISATSAVTHNLLDPGIYTGILPITKHALWKRIALWITKLDKIVKLLGIKKI